jgi:alpha-1,3-rhamnosyl/mannosyltransferase
MKRQKIFVDGLGLVDGHFSGVGQYILGILRGMDEILENDKLTGKITPEIQVIIPRDKLKRFHSFNFKHITPKIFPLPFRYMAALWHRGKLPPIDLWCGRGTYIFPRFVDMPLLFNKSSALVLFDLSFELHREYSDDGNALFLSKGVSDSIKRTKNIIAISQNAKNEIVDFYGVHPDSVKVATPAVDQKVFYRRNQHEIDWVKLKYGIKSNNYILALSNLEPRKNLGALVEAYCSLPASTRKDTALLLVGVNGWKSETLFDDILERVKDGYNIIRPSKYVLDDDKAAIISGARMLVYPSHYEGFGMPPLEALACGVPVITADNSSLPEVVSGVGKMLPSEDIEGLTKAILDGLGKIDKLSQEIAITGPKKAAQFSWIESAKTILDASLSGVKL